MGFQKWFSAFWPFLDRTSTTLPSRRTNLGNFSLDGTKNRSLAAAEALTHIPGTVHPRLEEKILEMFPLMVKKK